MKQTAVGYIENILSKLIEKFNSKEYKVARNTLINFKNVCIEQAKEMEKEQIIAAAADHGYPTEEIALKYAEQYYNETFKS